MDSIALARENRKFVLSLGGHSHAVVTAAVTLGLQPQCWVGHAMLLATLALFPIAAAFCGGVY